VSDHLTDEVLSRLIDGDLSLTGREAALSHLRNCSTCAQRHEALVSVAAVLRQEQPSAWRPADTARVSERISGEARVLQPRVAALLGGTAALVACLAFVVIFVSVPLAAFSIAGRVAGRVVPAMIPATVSSLLLAMLTVAVVAPLVAYPLARWR
jgi:anti-sigma factor RsiW